MIKSFEFPVFQTLRPKTSRAKKKKKPRSLCTAALSERDAAEQLLLVKHRILGPMPPQAEAVQKAMKDPELLEDEKGQVRAFLHAAVNETAIAKGIGFTTCPVSNSFVTDQMKSDEIVSLLRKGARVMVNSDDPAYFGGYVGDNYVALAEQAGLTATDLVQLAINSFEASWLTARRRDAFVQDVRDYAVSAGVELPV